MQCAVIESAAGSAPGFPNFGSALDTPSRQKQTICLLLRSTFRTLASPWILRLGRIKLLFASALDFSYLCVVMTDNASKTHISEAKGCTVSETVWIAGNSRRSCRCGCHLLSVRSRDAGLPFLRCGRRHRCGNRNPSLRAASSTSAGTLRRMVVALSAQTRILSGNRSGRRPAGPHRRDEICSASR